MNCPKCRSPNIQEIEDYSFCHLCDWDDLPQLPYQVISRPPVVVLGEGTIGYSDSWIPSNFSSDIMALPEWRGSAIDHERRNADINNVSMRTGSINGIQDISRQDLDQLDRYMILMTMGVLSISEIRQRLGIQEVRQFEIRDISTT